MQVKKIYLSLILLYFLLQPAISYAGCVGYDDLCERNVWRNSFLSFFWEKYLFFSIAFFLMILLVVFLKRKIIIKSSSFTFIKVFFIFIGAFIIFSFIVFNILFLLLDTVVKKLNECTSPDGIFNTVFVIPESYSGPFDIEEESIRLNEKDDAKNGLILKKVGAGTDNYYEIYFDRNNTQERNYEVYVDKKYKSVVFGFSSGGLCFSDTPLKLKSEDVNIFVNGDSYRLDDTVIVEREGEENKNEYMVEMDWKGKFKQKIYIKFFWSDINE